MLGSQDFAGHCVNIVFVFSAACCKFQLKGSGAVVVVEVFIIEYGVRCGDICLAQSNFPGLFSRVIYGEGWPSLA